MLCEIGEEIIRQFPQEGRREYVEGFEASKDVSVVLCHDHRLHIPEIHSHVEGALGIEITEDAAIFPIPQAECVLYRQDIPVVEEVPFSEVGIEAHSCFKSGAHGEDRGVHIRELCRHRIFDIFER